jgi:glucuronate isomerase
LKPFSPDVARADADAIMKKAYAGKPLTKAECETYSGYILGYCAGLNSAKGWVTQLHIGAVRDIRDVLFRTLGPDSGGDVSDHMIDIVHPLGRLLNKYDGSLKSVLYCLDAGHQASLATVARAFGGNVRLGSAWWLNDTPIGMRRQLEYIGSVDLLYNFAGMVSDSRKILSYGSRFEMFRRVLCDVVGGMVERGQIPYKLSEKLVERMCYSGPKEFFGL